MTDIRVGRLTAIAGAMLLLLPGAATADDAATHDLECYASIDMLLRSPDPKIRESAPLAATFYLGQLTEMGLAPAQIEKDIEDMALSPRQHPNILQPDFANACGAVPSAALAEMNQVQARDRAAMMREMGKPPKSR